MTKPEAELVGSNGNIFNILGIATRSLRKARQTEQIKEMTDRVMKAGSYSKALSIIGEYVEIV